MDVYSGGMQAVVEMDSEEEALPKTTAELLRAIAEDDFGLLRGPDVPSSVAKWACDAFQAAGGGGIVHERGSGLPEEYYVVKVI